MINVIGLGYIGLPTSLILSARGNKVIGSDINLELVKKLNNSEIPFEEQGLKELYDIAVMNGVKFQTDYVRNANVYIVTVPTPYRKTDHKIDTSYLEEAILNIGKVCKMNSIIVIESTISPGTTDKIVRPLIETFSNEVSLVHAPERILPGSMVQELVSNARTIGADNLQVGKEIKELYQTFCEGEITLTDINTAEMTKVVENTFRDVNIAFSNELNDICNKANLDVYEVIKIANKHPRVNILSPGPGVGGHCIPVDPWFLIADYPNESKLIKTARMVNQDMPYKVMYKLLKIMEDNGISNYSDVGIYGITYKENVDDIRESPTLQLHEIMKRKFDELPMFYDPYLNDKVVENQIMNKEIFLKRIRLIVIMVNHTELNTLTINDEMIVFDTKNTNIFDVNKLYKL